MRIGAHVDREDPLVAAKARSAEVVQIFLTDPQSYAAPKKRPDAAAIRAEVDSGGLDLVVHAPYRLNVATLNNRIRIPSRKLLDQHAAAAAELGANALVVHGGHVADESEIGAGLANWRKVFEYAARSGGFPLPILIENTAGGDNACARRFDVLARLWDTIGEY